MKISYGITLDDFRSLQPPFTLRSANSIGFKAVVVFCVLFAGFGVLTVHWGFGWALGAFIIGLSAGALLFAYIAEKRSVRKRQSKYENTIQVNYSHLHCHDSRTFEANENGFSFGCNCGTVTRPWYELVQASENKYLFLIGTKNEKQLVPKSAFHTTADETEFRALMDSKLHSDSISAVARVEFTYSKKDHRDAFFLHTLQAGGWRFFAKSIALLTCGAFCVAKIWSVVDPAIGCGLIGGLGVILLGMAAPLHRRKYLGNIRIDFNDSGLFLQDVVGTARADWGQFIGYLENHRVYLLYLNPRLYRLIPKRVLRNRDGAIRQLIQTKLPKYDYKNRNR